MIRQSAWLAIGCGLLFAVTSLAGANESTGAAAFQLLNDLLRREVREPVDRRAALEPTLRQNPQVVAPHWQAGFVQQNGQWKPFDVPLAGESQKVIDDYREQRKTARPTVSGQLSLASWCKQHGLKDQARVHYLNALSVATEAEREKIYPRLGYRKVGNQWLSPPELAEWKRSAQEAEAARKEWGPKLERIARMFGGNAKQRAVARAELNEITDPRAAPAIEQALAGRDFECAHAAVAALASINGHQSTLALADIAIFSESQQIRDAATTALKNRKKEDFVPALIEMLSLPIQSEFGIVQEPRRGILFYNYAWSREHHDRIDVRSSSVLNFLVDDALDGDVIVSPVIDAQAVARRQGDVKRALEDQLHVQERAKDAQNGRIEDINTRVSNVLAAVSGQKRTTDPKKWWGWWIVYGDIHRKEPKRVAREDSFRIVGDPGIGQRTFDSPAPPKVPPAPAPPPPPPPGTHYIIIHLPGECFRAGTPVWTESGVAPIEQIQVGDRVLSQNSETGELAWKPVMQVSVRPPKQLLRVSAGDEDITCTGGHRFWVAGDAWVRAEELRAGDLLHTATATVPITSISEGEKAEAYNLVVADFHSYFVGQQAFLVQDLPLPRSTNCVVPGLQPEW
ncbi:MAG TPA: polymorphic toxin-type HINT domain-containing protein [Planctomycetaceae bacterium]|nr:polymorphic toxin-type HINT domain-containing protein [Planctomycetaceae bacterium]